ncbi:hypothetical protein J2Z69_001600 [Paenibacillus shirakamiensis]|uniref:Uncharacterized protein n=1 Tax=Paenibacillus shirakamiensis TaxID=1265935 RepID=A0ABS4JFT8_9BACL|nr:hypothetical protein [Paenibacillus shirakamiensis]MBP2000569.1 hypothetical protein [Paenibacillus shirakamiensis]
MAKSQAKKLRERLIREGKRNPEAGRSPFASADLRTRTTKTRHEQLYKVKHKNLISTYGDDGSFLFYVHSSVLDLCS